MSPAPPGERVEALARAVDIATRHLPAHAVAPSAAVVEKIQGRLRHGTDHTVVALAGPTGAGKSTLFNALCGAEVSATGVRRPTTGAVHAGVWGEGAGSLLDWLGVSRRHHVDGRDTGLDGLVLLDLPDFDSTAVTHRIEVDRIVELVDVLVWVTDPQKYADESLHHGYLGPLAGHGEIMRFVLNKVDTLDTTTVDEVVADFASLIEADGIPAAQVVTMAASEGRGVDHLRSALLQEVEVKQAAIIRANADISTAAATLRGEGRSAGLSSRGRSDLVAGLGSAAGVEIAADLAAAQHRRDALDTMGWPPLRWWKRRGRHPVADLPRAGTTAASSAEIAATLRAAGEAMGDGLDPPWPAAVRRAAQGQQSVVEQALTFVTAAAARSHRTRPHWWSAVAWLQRALGLAALVGVLWLLALAVLGGFLRLDTDPLLIDTPRADWIPLPSALLLGGVVLGLLVAAVVRLPVGLGARRRARRTRVELQKAVTAAADEHVVAPLEAVLQDRIEMEQLLARAVGH